MGSSVNKLIILVPGPGPSHFSSAMEFAKLVVARDSRLSVFVLLLKFPFELANVTAASLSSSIRSERINFVDIPEGNSLTDSTPLNFFCPLYVQDAIRRISSADSVDVVGFILDMFCTPMIDVADEFGVPSYTFYTSGIADLCLGASLLLEDDLTEFEDELTVPGFANPVPKKVLPSLLQDKALVPVFKNLFRGITKSKGVLVNTFEDLQPGMIKALSSLASADQFPRVYPVGPIIKFNQGDKKAEIMEWLDEQPASSVVFLAFGDTRSVGGDQAREIAIALERTGVRFLWSLRQPGQKGDAVIVPRPTEYENPAEILPEGFLERTVGTGKVIGWAPQVAVLDHPAVGGFVSHCGWNSVLESVWFGVPVAAWPLHSEQHLNAFEMAKELGLAVEISLDTRLDLHTKDLDSKELVVKAEQIERGIVKLMQSESDLRKRVKEMSEKSRKALLPGGSSHACLTKFVNGLMGYEEC